jgi:hypothetical protein
VGRQAEKVAFHFGHSRHALYRMFGILFAFFTINGLSERRGLAGSS